MGYLLKAIIGEDGEAIRGFKGLGVPGHLVMAIQRDLELRIQGHLREIGQVNDDVIGGRQGFHPAVNGYERTLTSVAECATVDEVDEVATYIKNEIREDESRPANQKVRRAARTTVSRAGHPANDFLNAA